MCGLAGFARHPNAPHLEKAISVAEFMMRRIRHRGHHATGMATVGGASPFLWKWARPVDAALASDAWKEQRTKITPDTQVLIGHVRFATHNNGHKDECAHPFRMGQVCGAHNGMIRNWIDLAREFEGNGAENAWQVDSQAAFALLDRFDDPAEALRLLDGYWALTWTKGGKLMVVRSEGAPLAMAYVPAVRTLFWCSEMPILHESLRAAGWQSGEYEAWEIKTSTIYTYDPTAFDASGTKGTKTEVEFVNRRNGKTDSRTSGMAPARGGGAVYPSAGQEWRSMGGFSTRTTRDPFEDAEDGDQLALRRRGGGKGKGGKRGGSVAEVRQRTENMDTSDGVSLKGLANVMKRLANRMTEAEAKLEEVLTENAQMFGRLQAAEAEIEYLYEVLNDAGVLDMPEEPDKEEPPHRCTTCGKGEDAGEMVEDDQGGFVHTACTFRQAPEGASLVVGMA